MKRINLLCIALGLSLAGFAQPVTQGLQLSYYFDGNAADSSGNGRDATEINGPTYTLDRFGNPNSALSLDGSNDYVKLTNANFLANNEFTLSAWVQLKSWASSGSQDMLVNLGSTTYDHGLNAAKGYLGTYDGFTAFSYNSTSGNAKGYDNTFQVNLNDWYHLAITRNGQKLQFFINGQLVDEDIVNTNPGFTASNSLWIGSRTGTTFFANANIDDFTAYDRVLSAAEVLSLYSPVAPPPPVKNPICVSYFFNANFQDSSANGLHLTNKGATFTSDRHLVSQSAIEVNGSNQYVELSNADSLISSELTIAAWALINTLPNPQEQGSIVCLGSNTYDHGLNFANNYLGTYTGFTGYSYTTANSNAGAYIKTGGSFTTNTWYHVAMTRDSASIKMYIDGKLADSNALSNGAAFSMNGNKLWIGARLGNQSFFNGKIDDILICNLVKSGQEIDSLYQTGAPSAVQTKTKEAIKIYPNPSAGKLTIEVPEYTEASKVHLFNSLGQLVQSEVVAPGTMTISVDKSGIYFIKLMNSNNQIISTNQIVIY